MRFFAHLLVWPSGPFWLSGRIRKRTDPRVRLPLLSWPPGLHFPTDLAYLFDLVVPITCAWNVC